MAIPRTALHELIAGLPLARAADANFKKMTISFELRAGQVAAPGQFALVPESAIVAAFQADGQFLQLLPVSGGVRIDWRMGCGDLAVDVSSDNYSSTVYFERIGDHTDPFSRKPGTWWGSEYRTDAHGRSWSRSLGTLVTDNFGDLVEVAE